VQLPLLLTVVSRCPADAKSLGALASCSRSLSLLLLELDALVWQCAFQYSTVNMHIPKATLSEIRSWQDLIRYRIHHSRCPYVRVLSESDLQPGDWMDWNVSVAVIGLDTAFKKSLLERLVRYDEKHYRRQSAYLRPCALRSCIVEAFGSRGRLVFADFDGRDLELVHRPQGGLENCDVVIAVCDKNDGSEGAAACELLIQRADAVISENLVASRSAQLASEGPPPRFIVLAGQSSTHQMSIDDITCNNPKVLTRKLQLTNAVDDLSCEIVATSVQDDASVDPLLHLIAWRLIKQSSARRERLVNTTGHRLLDSRVFWRGYGKNETSARRRSHSMS